MKLIVNRKTMLSNVRRAEMMCRQPIALMFKDFYTDMYDSRFSSYTSFSNDAVLPFDVTANIGNPLGTRGKVITSLAELKAFEHSTTQVYVPVNFLDNREGVCISEAKEILRKFGDRDNAYIMLTSGCISADAPMNEEIESLHAIFDELAIGVSVGGSFYLQRLLPSCVKEVRIGEYMLYGTIPYCNRRELFGTPALVFQSEVIAVYPERKQILVDGGTTTINAKDSFLLSGGLQYSNASCDYTIYDDPFYKYKVGDTIEIIPDYHSLKLMRNVAREYTE